MKPLSRIVSVVTLFCSVGIASATNYTPTVFNDPPVSGGVNSANGVITGGAGNGQVSLRSAVIAANAHAGADTITLGSGTYTLTISSGGTFENAAASGDLDINDSVAISGNGPASTVVTTTYDSTCGDGKVFGVNQDGTHTGLNVSFTGLTIQNGFNNGINFQGSFFETGGGVDFYMTGAGSGALSAMTNCVVANCVTTNSPQCHGGGVNVDSTGSASVGGASVGNAYFVNCVFSNNVSMREGGGLCLHADKHDVVVTGCTFIKNRADSAAGLNIQHSYGGTVTVNNCSSISNTATVNGGGVYVGYNTSVAMNSTVIAGNSATGASSQGGGLFVSELGLAGFTPIINFSGCTITNNHADGASALGGGVYCNRIFSTTISGSVISGNTAKTGAGIANSGNNISPPDILTILNCTISGNVASGNGGGVESDTANSITLLSKCTVSGNSAVSGGAFYVNNGFFTNNFSRVVNNTAASGSAVTRIAGTANVTNNWWGINSPAALMSGTVNFTPWLQLTNTANPNAIVVPNATTLTASFLTNSAGAFVAAANLDRLIGLPITFNNAVRGTLSGAQATIQSSGTATATFTANAAGAGSADAVVDNQTVTAPITVNAAPTINCPTTIATNAAGYCVPSIAFASTTAGSPAPVVSYKLGATPITSPYAFPIGTNVVTATATNAVGTNTCNFNVIVAPGAAPQLSIVRSSTNVIVSWSNSYPCYTFQFAPVLASNSWSSYPGPFATNNGKIFVTNNAPFTNRFFRLKF